MPKLQTTEKLKVLMLASNPVEYDTRVIKCAESIASYGLDVTVLCKQGGASKTEVKNRVKYDRHPFITSPKALIKKAWSVLRNKPKKGFHFSYKSLSLIFALAAVGVIPIMVLFPFYLIEERANRNKPSFCKKAINVYLSKLLLLIPHPYITSLTFFSLYEPLLKHKPDIIHAHDIDTLMLAAIAAKAYGIPYIYDAHEYEYGRVNRKGLINQLLIRFDETKYISNSHVITVSDGIAELLTKDYTIQKPIVTYNAPITTSPASAKGQTIKEKLKLKQSDFLVVYVGLISAARCLTKILNALPYTQNIHFACVGPHYQPVVEELDKLAISINKTHYFHILPAVPYHEVSHFISSADAGIVILDNLCLSYEHAMPNKFFETLCAGLPMVMSNQKEMRALAEHHKLGVFVKDTSPKEIAKAISKLQSDYKIYKPSTEKTRALRAKFGWEAQEKKLLSLYKNLGVEPKPQPKTQAIDSH